MSVNERINFLVKEVSGGSQTAFANLIGIKAGSVSDIVGGRLNKPSFDVLQKIVIAIPGLNMNWLLTGEGVAFAEKGKPEKVSSGNWSQTYSPSNDVRVNSEKAKEVSSNTIENPMMQFLMNEITDLKQDKKELKQEISDLKEELKKYKNRESNS